MANNALDEIPAVQDLITAFPLPTLIIGREGRVMALNSAAEELLGKTVLGRHFAIALRHPRLVEATELSLRDRASREVSYQMFENGGDTHYQAHLRAIEGSELLLLSFQNATKLAQAERMRREFVANVSHELRTPLAALMGFIETMQGRASEDSAAQARFLGIMADEAERMNRLVSGLLSLSRVEADERARPTGQLDLRDVLQTALRNLGRLAADSNVTLRPDLGEAPLHVLGDSDQRLQVFTNLVENAIKYAGENQQVDIIAQRLARDPVLRGPALQITVADHGPGIDPIHLPRLTERFYRADDHRSRALGGTGLGLAIVKHILNRHRGRLKITSQPGQGAQFAVILPFDGSVP